MRFTIRELVLLTLVVAMGVGWLVDRARLNATHRRQVRAQVEFIYDRQVEIGHLQYELSVLRTAQSASPLP